jgi:hypothetical protein
MRTAWREAAAQAAWATDRGQPIVAAVIAALHTAGIILPPAAVIERAAIAGRARARKRATDALLAGVTEEQVATRLIDDGRSSLPQRPIWQAA